MEKNGCCVHLFANGSLLHHQEDVIWVYLNKIFLVRPLLHCAAMIAKAWWRFYILHCWRLVSRAV